MDSLILFWLVPVGVFLITLMYTFIEHNLELRKLKKKLNNSSRQVDFVFTLQRFGVVDRNDTIYIKARLSNYYARMARPPR